MNTHGADLARLAPASLRLDAALARCRHLPAGTRTRLLIGKYAALAHLARGRPAQLRVGPLTVSVHNLSDLGTLQSAIVDVQHTLIATDLLRTEHAPRVIDVGANLGQFAAAVLLAAPHARLDCFEPDPASHARLTATLAGTAAPCRGHQLALADHTGTATLHRHPLSVMSTLHPDSAAPYTAGTVTVPVTTLDAALPDDDPIDLVKIDVEGAESDVLAGAHRTLTRTRHLLIELSLHRATRHTNLDVLDQIRTACPTAQIHTIGRPLGPAHRPTCQDILIALHPPDAK